MMGGEGKAQQHVSPTRLTPKTGIQSSRAVPVIEAPVGKIILKEIHSETGSQCKVYRIGQ